MVSWQWYSRQNWSSQRSVSCFSTAFTLLHHQEVPSTYQSLADSIKPLIGGGWQREGHFWHVGFVEGKLCKLPRALSFFGVLLVHYCLQLLFQLLYQDGHVRYKPTFSVFVRLLFLFFLFWYRGASSISSKTEDRQLWLLQGKEVYSITALPALHQSPLLSGTL